MRNALPVMLLALLACAPEAEAPPPAAAPPPREPPPVAFPAPATRPGPPAARVAPVTDAYFGVSVVDPYRWMEEESTELSDWMRSQNDWTRRQLQNRADRDKFLARVHALNKEERVFDVAVFGGRTFYAKRPPEADNYKYYVQDGTAAERLLIDSEAMTKDGKHFSIDWEVPSFDGKLLAYGVSPSGSEDSVLHVLDVATGKDLPDTIDRLQFSNVSWVDGKRFTYTRLQRVAPGAPRTDRYKNATAYLHTLGGDPDKDPRLLGAGVVPDVSVSELEIGSVSSVPGSATALGWVQDGVRNEARIYTAPKASLGGAKTAWSRVCGPEDEVTDAALHGDDLFLLSHKGQSHFQVLRVSASKPNLAAAKITLPAGELVLKGLTAAKDALYVRAIEAGIGRIKRVDYAGAVTDVPLPFDGAIDQIFSTVLAPGFLVRVTGWTKSPRWLRYDPATKKLNETGLLAPSAADFSAIRSIETKAKSKDGTLVPLSVVFKGDIARDGSHPAWMDGYGGYGITIDPFFSPSNLAWLERGGVFAYCHVRGGGELGEDWHRAGMLANKQNSIDDFVACAKTLAEQGFSRAAKLAGEGTSAGGMVIGGAVTQHPELFGAALIRVGVSNALRFEKTLNVLNVPEMGSVKTEEGFKALLVEDAYSHVKDGTKFPSILLTTGATDPRVAPWQVTKMAARLQAANAGDNPILLRVDYDAGHGMGSTRSQREEELADEMAFLSWRLDAP